MTKNAIGIVELSSIAAGYSSSDEMLKAANVDMLLARSICSRKYMVMVGGDVADVPRDMADVHGHLEPRLVRHTFDELEGQDPCSLDLVEDSFLVKHGCLLRQGGMKLGRDLRLSGTDST